MRKYKKAFLKFSLSRYMYGFKVFRFLYGSKKLFGKRGFFPERSYIKGCDCPMCDGKVYSMD